MFIQGATFIPESRVAMMTTHTIAIAPMKAPMFNIWITSFQKRYQTVVMMLPQKYFNFM